MRQKLARFMIGRYGTDQLSRTMLIVALIAILVASLGFKGSRIVYYIAVILLFGSYFRMFSRNISKRYAENQKFLAKTAGIRNYFRVQKSRFAQRKVYRFYHCPQCNQTVRVPRGRGRIAITCPKCKLEFIKKS